MRGRGPGRWLLAALLLGAAAPAAGAEPSRAALLDTLEFWHHASRPDRVDSLAGPAIAAARRSGDRAGLADLLLARGRTRAAFGRAKPAEPDLQEALALVTAAQDTTARLQALRWLAVALGQLGRTAEALRAYHDLEALASAHRDSVHLGWAWTGRAFDHYGTGRADSAIVLYGAAAGVLDRAGVFKGAIFAWNGQALALRQAGRFAEAAAGFRRALVLARASNDALNEALALNYLGRLELYYGDPGQAERMFARAAAIHERHQHAREGLLPRIDMATARILQGRPRDAAALLDSLRAAADSLGLADLAILASDQLADVHLAEGRPGAAAALCRRTLARTVWPSTMAVTEVRLRLAVALAARDSAAAALAVLDEISAAGPGAETLRREAAARRGRLLLALGRPGEALLAARDALAMADRAAGPDPLAVPLGAVLGCAWLAAGRVDSARTAFATAVAQWEALRTVPEDPQWRERRAADAGELFVHAVRAELLAPAAPEAAFALLQRYKARTLLERMLGPGRPLPDAAPPLSLAELQRTVLEQGEALLDVVQGPDRGLAFLVMADTVLVGDLPGARASQALVRRLEDALTSRAVVDPGPASGLAAALFADLPAPLRARLRAARRLDWCPDGVYHRVPLAVLAGEDGLVRADCALVTVPAATILARLRAAPPPPRAGTLVAVSGRDPDGTGPLPGAAAETRWLAARLRHVRRVDATDAGALDPAAWREAAVLHLAAHVVLDAEQPWQTAVALGPGPRGQLRAADVAERAVGAQLAVLSGCRTAGTVAVGGEGLLGLAAGFLAAGTPAVVATLWDVDDLAAARFMAAFYGALAAGDPPATALAAARERCRRDPATAAPRHWAGFVLVGDGGRPVPVRSRLPLWPAAVPLLAAAVALLRRARRA